MILQYTLPYFRQQRVEFSRARRALPPNVSRKMKYLPSTWRSLRFQQSHSKVNSPRLSREWTHSTGSPEVDKARMELAEDLVWARSATSRLLLSQPPFLEEDFGNNGTALDSLDAYLKARRWPVPPGPAKRFLSHLLTYPLTLAAGLTEARIGVHGAEKPGGRLAVSGGGRRPLSVVCVGARAEGSLPLGLWREALFALPGVSHLNLYLMGPEVVIPSRQQLDSMVFKSYNTAPATGVNHFDHNGLPNLSLSHGSRTLKVTWIRAMIERRDVHTKTGRIATIDKETSRHVEEASRDVAGVEEALENADAFVLFNPGLGHQHLLEGWTGAVELLLQSGVPVILTGHSEQDLGRDVRQLALIGERCCTGWSEGRGKRMFPQRNAFGSLRRTEDPLAAPGAELVSPNWGILVLDAINTT